MIYYGLPLTVLAGYPILLIYTFFVKQEMFFKTLFVPAAVFLLITLLRKAIKEQRPYDKFKTAPVIAKESKPDSMPSRHTASAFIIATAFMSVNIYAGISYMLIALLISLSRICAGVHYVKDVIAGAAISLTVGIIFILIL